MKGVDIVGKVEWVDEEAESPEGVIILTSDNFYVFPCPHCLSLIRVRKDQLKCRIFRHGVFKKNGRGINPHLGKKKCDELTRKACVYGCAKPFEFINGGEENDGSENEKNCVVRGCEYK